MQFIYNSILKTNRIMNVFDYFFTDTKERNKDFIVNSNEVVSFNKLHDDSLLLAHYLFNRMGENNRIILISQNSVFFVTCYLAIIKSGNICVPLNPLIEQENYSYIEELIQCELSLVSKQVKQSLNIKSEIIKESNLNEILQSFEDNTEDKTKDKWLPEAFDENRLAEILFTSGSTGISKGVMLTHLNLRANTESILAYLKLTSDDSMLLVLPLFYCYGLSVLHTHLKVGAKIVFNNNFILLGSIIDDLQKYQCSGFAGVPSHYQMLLRKSKTFKNTRFEHLRYVTQAGGKLHEAFIEEFIETFPDINFYVMYGQTEATARLSYLEPLKLKSKLGSIGKAIPGVILKVLGVDGKDVVTGEVGEIVAKGDNVMKGYLDDTKETSQVLKDGWLYTGDLGVMDNEGFIYLTSRKKEIMKIGGHRISPKEIEEVIVSISEVVDCTVVAIDDELLGEAIKAIIVINEETDKNYLKSKVINLCRSRLSPNKTPHLIEFVLNLKVSSSGKKIKDQSIN